MAVYAAKNTLTKEKTMNIKSGEMINKVSEWKNE